MNNKTLVWLTLGVIFILGLGVWQTAPALAQTGSDALSTPRPTFVLTETPPTPTPTPTTTPSVGPAMGASVPIPRLRGGVMNWGQGYMPAGVQVVLQASSEQIPVYTNASGEYGFQDIGNRIVFLNAVVPSDRPDLVALTTDLPVRMRSDQELVINLAFYAKGLAPDPLAILKMNASSPQARPDDTLSFTLVVSNTWDHDIHQVIVADYLPTGLQFVSATASQGQVIFDQGLVWADLGPMPPKSAAIVTIAAQVNADAKLGETITHRAALYYQENAAVQTQVQIKVVEKTNGVLPVTGLAPILPTAGVLLAGLIFGLRKLRRSR